MKWEVEPHQKYGFSTELKSYKFFQVLFVAIFNKKFMSFLPKKLVEYVIGGMSYFCSSLLMN